MTEPTCTPTDHEWNPGVTDAGVRYLVCVYCAASVPSPIAAPGVQLVDLGLDEQTPDL